MGSDGKRKERVLPLLNLLRRKLGQLHASDALDPLLVTA
jgi:hypothetical protein